MWRKEAYTFEVRSLVRFRHLPSRLLINDGSQEIKWNHFYTEQAASVLWSKRLLTQQYTAGFSGEGSNLKNGYEFYFQPFYQWKAVQWRASLNLPFAWKKYTNTDFERFTLSPSLSLNFKLN